MPLDPSKSKKILVVHGVQTGKDASLDQDALIRKLFRARRGDAKVDCSVDIYRYEDLNDAALARYKALIDLLVKNPVGAALAKAALELMGDVLISLAQGSTADAIRQGLRARILENYEAGHPTYLVAHSLGSVYAFDVINMLMRDEAYFKRPGRARWPVMGLVTLGSPLGLGMFKGTGRARLEGLGRGKPFPWRNYYDENDPVVSGSLFGAAIGNARIAEAFGGDTGWSLLDLPVNTGKLHLAAHTGYWDNAHVGDGIRDTVIG